MKFQLESPYKPAGDLPEAIKRLTASLEAGNRFQTLLGGTGSGKTLHRHWGQLLKNDDKGHFALSIPVAHGPIWNPCRTNQSPKKKRGGLR